ncbi:MAG TPA: polysaccharide deacetylase family protein [Rhodothermales bacterium]|nr:polysaccharide deacetylase family protein [Rhodothermales bacterium]
MYHSLDESGSVVSVSPELFARQMEHLVARGYETVTFAGAVELLRAGSPAPERCVVITFDDAYENVYTRAFPVLQRHGFTATIFAISAYCGCHNDWPGHESPVGRLALMSWAGLREVHRHGIEVGAHTRTHPDLSHLSAAAAEAEILTGAEEIQERLGAGVSTFAYPYGGFNEVARSIVGERFRGACTTRLGLATDQEDPYLLPRIDAYYFRQRSLFTSLPGPALRAYLGGRQLLRDFKKSIL